MLCYFFEVFRICRSKWRVSNSRIETASVMVEDDSFWEPFGIKPVVSFVTEKDFAPVGRERF